MPDSPDARAKEIFNEAIDLRGEARSAFLHRACADDSALRDRVENLLAGAEKADSFLNAPTTGVASPEAPGTIIGPYKILEQIGEGGFGSVYEAEQSAPVRRHVALKIIKLGMDTRAVVARFEQERQALAVMDHAGIARVFDAGATSTGRPYFVMELVKGEPITKYCDACKADIPARLDLFLQVCRAVQHAHTKGVIHRDIKPTNVLAGTQDDRPFCKIIDFGIAKATQSTLTGKTIFTEMQQFMGTPAYMSPEQAAGTLDVDTRTDVYSLGVLLYELLAGALPFDPATLRSAAYNEMQRIIREVDPPTPSTRIAQSRETLAGIAAQRRIEPARLGPLLRRELDWIVMRALEKDPARRYESAGNLASDIEHYLAGEPVEAAPQSAAYRFRKLVRRHRFGVTAAGLVALSLVLGLGAAVWQGQIAARERDIAKRAATEAVAARNEAEAQRKETEQIAEFQSAQLRDIDVEAMGSRLHDDLLADLKSAMEQAKTSPAEIARKQEQLAGLLSQVSITDVALKALDKTIFDHSLKALDEQFKNQPALRARLLQTLAEIMLQVGLLEAATVPQAKALEIRRALLGDHHHDTLYSLLHWGTLLQARGKLPQAEAAMRDVVSKMRGVVDPNDLLAMSATDNLAVVLQTQGKLAEAEPLFRDGLARVRRVLGPDSPETLAALNNLGMLSFGLGKYAEAAQYFGDALARLRRVAGNDDPGTLKVMSNLASIIQREDKLIEAEGLFREALERSGRTQGKDHPDTMQFANNLGFVLFLEKKYEDAEPLLRDTLERRRRLLHDDHWDTLQSINNVGILLEAQGKMKEAEPFLREALTRREHVFGRKHQSTLQSICNLGCLLLDTERLEEAEPLLREAFDSRRETLGADHPDTLESAASVGELLIQQGKFGAAEVQLRAVADAAQRRLGENHPDAAEARAALAESLFKNHKFAEAEPLLLSAEAILATAPPWHVAAHRKCVIDLIALYDGWEAGDPAHGHAASADKWHARQR